MDQNNKGYNISDISWDFESLYEKSGQNLAPLRPPCRSAHTVLLHRLYLKGQTCLMFDKCKWPALANLALCFNYSFHSHLTWSAVGDPGCFSSEMFWPKIGMYFFFLSGYDKKHCCIMTIQIMTEPRVRKQPFSRVLFHKISSPGEPHCGSQENCNYIKMRCSIK